MRVLAHVITVVVLFGLLFGVPAGLFANPGAFGEQETDVTSSASLTLDAPSGNFTMLLNRSLHPDDEVRGHWVSFLKGEDVPLIMEDVTCTALVGDAAGIELAHSLQSRLPVNQMRVSVQDGALAVSKAGIGRFDILVMSDEMADVLEAQTLYGNADVEVVRR